MPDDDLSLPDGRQPEPGEPEAGKTPTLSLEELAQQMDDEGAPAGKPAKAKQEKKPKEPKKPKAPKEKKPGRSLRDLFKYRVAISLLQKSKELSQETGDSLAEPEQEGKGKAKKAPKAKKEKTPKGKKEKAAKVKAPRAKKEKAPKEGGKSHKKMFIFIGIGVVAVAGGAVAAILMTRGITKSPQELFDEATALATEREYAAAIELFDEVIDTGELLPEAYLGAANAMVSQGETPPPAEDTGESGAESESAEPAAPPQPGVEPEVAIENAIAKLTEGLVAVPGDETLQARLDELQNPPEPEPEADAENPNANAPVTSAPIEWADPAFEAMVRLALGRPEGDISEVDLAGIHTLRVLGNTHAVVVGGEFLAQSPDDVAVQQSRKGVDGYTINGEEFTERGEITSLADAAHFPDLTSLSVGYNRIDDLSGLGGMRLSTLGIYANNVTSLAPLAELDSLHYLYAYNNTIGSLEGLEAQSGLLVASLQHNEVSDLSPLSGLATLRELLLRDNLVESLEPLAGLSGLRILDVQDNDVASIAAVADLPELTDLNIIGNPVEDRSPADAVQNVRYTA